MSDDVTEDLDMSWIDVAVFKTEGDERVVGYSPGFEGFIDGSYLCDNVDEYDAPAEPGLYRWSDFKVGSWDNGDAMHLTGGTWTPYRLSTPSPDSGERMREAGDLPAVLPGHWTTPAGRDMALATLDDPHMARSRERISDFALANEVFLSPGIANLTDAKERIRWLSATLAALQESAR